MAKRGPKPKPKTQLKLAGTYRADRHGDCPDAAPVEASCPDWLSDAAKAFWPEVSARLSAMRLNSVDYTFAIAMICDALADWARLDRLMEKTTWLAEDDHGKLRANPGVRLKFKAWERVIAVCKEFGMTPVAMRGIARPEEPKDDLEQMLTSSKTGA